MSETIFLYTVVAILALCGLVVVLGFAIDILHRRLARIEEKLEKLRKMK